MMIMSYWYEHITFCHHRVFTWYISETWYAFLSDFVYCTMQVMLWSVCERAWHTHTHNRYDGTTLIIYAFLLECEYHLYDRVRCVTMTGHSRTCFSILISKTCRHEHTFSNIVSISRTINIVMLYVMSACLSCATDLILGNEKNHFVMMANLLRFLHRKSVELLCAVFLHSPVPLLRAILWLHFSIQLIGCECRWNEFIADFDEWSFNWIKFAVFASKFWI